MRMKFTTDHTIYCCYSAYVVGAVVNNLPALLFMTFHRDYGFSPETLATLVIMNFVVQMVVDYFGARFADRIGYRNIVIAAQLFEAVGLVAMSFLPRMLPPYIGLITATLLYSIGSGLTEVIISPITEALPGEDKAKKMGLMHSFYCWGVVATTVLSTAFFYVFGIDKWPVLCLVWAILPVVNAFLFARVPIYQLGGNEGKTTSIGAILRLKLIGFFLVLMLCSGAAEQAIAQWASYFVENELAVSKQTADLLGPCLFSVTMGIARVIYAKSSTRVPIYRSLLLSAVLCGVSFLLIGLSPIPALAVFGCALGGLAVGVFWPGTLSFAAENCPEGGTPMFAILALGGDIGCFTGPWLVAKAASVVSAGESVKPGMPFGALFPVLMIGFLLIVRRKKSKSNG